MDLHVVKLEKPEEYGRKEGSEAIEQLVKDSLVGSRRSAAQAAIWNHLRTRAPRCGWKRMK